MYNRMVNYMYIFDITDMIGLIGICNKEKLIRQLSLILMVESGKLKRLLIPKDHYRKGLYDILYYNEDSFFDNIS